MTPAPAEIVAQLDRYVVGQDRAKRTLAHAVAQHYLAIAYEGDVRIEKANVLLLGPTGVGKSYLVRTVANLLAVPFYGHTATAISPSGWVGEHAEDLVVRLNQRSKQRFGADGSWARTRRGIIYIDEVDKLALRGGQGTQAGVSTEAKFNTVQVQQSLLRLIEGTEVQVDGNPMDTSQILFVASGAFVGIEGDIARRLRRPRNSAPPAFPLRDVLPADLVAYGLTQEFVGRFPVAAALDPLSADDLVAVMRDARNGLVEQKRAMLSAKGCDLEIDEPTLKVIAGQALLQGTGARALQSIIERRLTEARVLDLAPGTLVRFTADGVQTEMLGEPSGPRLAAGPAFAGEPSPPSDGSISAVEG